MNKSKKIVTAAAGAALMLMAGVAAVQQQQGPQGLNADSLAAKLELSSDVKAQIAPQIDELNALLAQQEQFRQQHADLRNKLANVRGEIAQALTPEQRRGFAQALRQAWGRGPGAGRGAMGLGRGMGAGPGAMGQGSMGRGSMGQGRHMMGRGAGFGQGMGAGAMRGGRMGSHGFRMGGMYGPGSANCPYAQQGSGAAAQDSVGS